MASDRARLSARAISMLDAPLLKNCDGGTAVPSLAVFSGGKGHARVPLTLCPPEAGFAFSNIVLFAFIRIVDDRV